MILSVVAVLLRSNCNWLTKANLLLCCVTSYSSGSVIGLTPWIALGLAVSMIAAGRMSAQFLTLTSQRYRLSELLSSFLSRRPLLFFWTVVKSSLIVICLSILALRLMNYVETDSSDDSPAFPIASSSSLTGGRLLSEESYADPASDTISWERYRNYCVQPLPSGSDSTIASTQLACSALNGVHIQWEGVVRQVVRILFYNLFLEYF